MPKQILVLGATGMLGRPFTRQLIKQGYRVRLLARNAPKAGRIFGGAAEIISGSALSKDDIQTAIAGCDAVHISLPQSSELAAMQHVADLARSGGLERITYVSATTAREENRWFDLIDIKLRAEAVLQGSGIPYTIFCPTWAMETLRNFVRNGRATAIISKNPPPLHFVAAADFGRMAAASYADERTIGKRLFIHGPEAVTLPQAAERFIKTCHPDLKITRLKLWQAQLIAKLTGNKELTYATRLIAYFDKVGELGDPTEANALLGAPAATLDDWFEMEKSDH